MGDRHDSSGRRDPYKTTIAQGRGSLFDGWLWLRRHWRRRVEEGAQGGLVEDGDVECVGAVELGAGVFAGDEVGGLPADGGGDASSGGFDEVFCGFAGEGGERAGEDEGESGEGGGGDFFLGGHSHFQLVQLVYQLPIARLGEELDDGLGDARADLVNLLQLFGWGEPQGFHRAEVGGKELGGALADEADAKGEEETGEARGLRESDLIEQGLSGLFAHAVELEQVFLAERVEVGESAD